MLSSEFTNEMGALLRSLSKRVAVEPELAAQVNRSPEWMSDNALDGIDAAIISLVALRLRLQQKEGQ